MRNSLSLLFLLTLFHVACTPASVPLPPELAQSNDHLEVVSSSKLFSLESELRAGQYLLKVVRHERDDREQKAGGMQSVRIMSYELTLLKNGKEAGTAKCMERLGYTDAAGDSMANQDVEDSLACNGLDAEGSPWTLKTALQESGDAAGFFEHGKTALKISSLQKAPIASKGQIRGYQIADEQGALVATERVSPESSGALWLRKAAVPSDALVVASLALTLYVPMR